MQTYIADRYERARAEKATIIGKRFGNLTVTDIKLDATNPRRSYWYAVCQCDCGKTCEPMYHNVTSGGSKSCGCLKHGNRMQKRLTWRCKETGYTFSSTAEMAEHSGISYTTAMSKANRGFEVLIGHDGRTYELVGPTPEDEPRRETIFSIRRRRKERLSQRRSAA